MKAFVPSDGSRCRLSPLAPSGQNDARETFPLSTERVGLVFTTVPRGIFCATSNTDCWLVPFRRMVVLDTLRSSPESFLRTC